MTNSRRRQTVVGALLLFCTGLLIPVAVDSNTDLDEQIICGGIVIAEKALLRSGPDSSSGVIKELPFGAPFYSLGDPDERRRFYEQEGAGREPPPWFHVLLPDSTTSGWVTSREVREAAWWYAGSERDDFAQLRYYVARRSVREKDFETAERLFRDLLKDQPEAVIGYNIRGGWTWGNAKTGTLMGLAMMYRSLKDYEKAIEHYEMIASDTSDSAVARANAWLMIMRTYHRDLKDHASALQTAYAVIVDFPEQLVIGFEHFNKSDIEAAEYAMRMLREEPRGAVQLIHHGQRMIDIASNPTVKMIGHVLLCEGYRGQRQYERMKETVMNALLKWPTALGGGYKECIDYSQEALGLVVESLTRDIDAYDQALAFCEELLSRTDDPTLHRNLICERARLWDFLQVSKDDVISAYRECGAWKRLGKILAFREYETTVSMERVAVKPRPTHQAKDLFILSRGDRVTVLYEDPILYDQEDWLKVQSKEKRIGWVEKSALASE